jgi:hypothetical protein
VNITSRPNTYPCPTASFSAYSSDGSRPNVGIAGENGIKDSHATTNAPPVAKRQTDKLFVRVAVAMVATVWL